MRYTVEEHDQPQPRPTPPDGYADGVYVGGLTPMPGWVCTRCGGLVVRVDWHDDWHRRLAGESPEPA